MYMYMDIRCRKKKRGKEREESKSVPDDFTTMINRHRLLIVLDLDGGTAGRPGLVFRTAQRDPARLIHWAAKDARRIDFEQSFLSLNLSPHPFILKLS